MSVEDRPYPIIADAICERNLDAVQVAFDRFPEAQQMDVPAFGTWLHYAASEGDLAIVDHLLGIGFDANAVDSRDGRRPICNAADSDNPEIVQRLIDKGSLLDTSASIRNPLFSAIVGRSRSSALLLLQAGIDPTPRYLFTRDGGEPLDALAFAALQGEREIAYLLARLAAGDDETKVEGLVSEARRLAGSVVEAHDENAQSLHQGEQ